MIDRPSPPLRRLLAVLAFAGLATAFASGCSSSTRVAPPVADPVIPTDSVEFQAADCAKGAFEGSVPDGRQGSCHLLTVAEDRDRADRSMVTIPVVRIRGVGPSEAVPLIYLPGGPGESGLDAMAWFTETEMGRTRDTVYFDPRGTGGATPGLNCPEVESVIWQNTESADSLSVEGERLAAGHQACAERLEDQVDLQSYGTSSSVDDVEDLIEALELEEYDLYGMSYGTTLGLELLERRPPGLRVVVLDSVVPPWRSDDPDQTAERAEGAFSRLQDACDAQPVCAASHPDLRASLLAAREVFDERPHRVGFDDVTGTPRVALLTGDDVVRGALQAMYDPALIASLPTVFEALERGDAAILDALGPALLGSSASLPEGGVASVSCIDRHVSSQADLERLRAEHPLAAASLVARPCDRWPVAVDPQISSAFRPTSVPVMVLAGGLDPATPADDGRRVADELGELATFVSFPALAHGIGWHPCAQQVVTAFLADPAAKVPAECERDLVAPTFA